MQFRRNTAIAMALLIAGASAARAEEKPSAAKLIAEGNADYAQGKYVDALEDYRAADDASPGLAEAAFNRGLSHYQLGEVEQAKENFNQALLSENKSLEAAARFNLGNCSYADAIGASEKDPKAAIESLKRAIGFYADALELAPERREARENMQLARQLIKQLEEQQKQQEQQQQQKNDQQNQDQKDQQKQDQQQQKDQQKQDQQKQDQQQNQQGQQDDKNKDDQQQQQKGQQGQDDQQKQDQQQQQQQGQNESEQNQDQQQQQDQQQGGQSGAQDQSSSNSSQQESEGEGEPQEVSMSKEQAQRVLQAVRDKERARRMDKKNSRRVTRATDGKDW